MSIFVQIFKLPRISNGEKNVNLAVFLTKPNTIHSGEPRWRRNSSPLFTQANFSVSFVSEPLTHQEILGNWQAMKLPPFDGKISNLTGHIFTNISTNILLLRVSFDITKVFLKPNFIKYFSSLTPHLAVVLVK